MNSFVRFVAILAGLGFGQVASAAGPAANHYFGASYYQQSTEFNYDTGTATNSVSSSPDSFMFKYGYSLGRNLSVEVHTGMSTEEVDEVTGYSVANDYMFSVFARGSLPLSAQNVTLYVLAGASSGKATYNTEESILGVMTPVSYSKSLSGVSYGAGAELFGTPSTSFHVEWISYLSADDYTSSGLVLGITHHFGMPKLW